MKLDPISAKSEMWRRRTGYFVGALSMQMLRLRQFDVEIERLTALLRSVRAAQQRLDAAYRRAIAWERAHPAYGPYPRTAVEHDAWIADDDFVTENDATRLERELRLYTARRRVAIRRRVWLRERATICDAEWQSARKLLWASEAT